MDTNQLIAFEQVVRHGSFSKAARIMDISQPTISIRIQNLERAVGGELFNRGGSRLELSELGRTFLPFAQKAVETLNKGVELAQMAKEGRGGKIVIGTLPTLAAHYFSSTLAKLHKANPNLEVIVHTGHNQEILEMLHNGLIKLGIMTYPFFNTELKSLLHIKEPLMFVSHCKHQLARKAEIDIKDIRELADPFLLVDWSMEAKRYQLELISQKRAEFEVPPPTAYDMLKNGMGAALLTETMVAQDIADGTLVKLNVNGFPQIYRESALVQFKRETDISPSLQTFIDAFKDEVKNNSCCLVK
ncbi:LysR family transcriptional regulator [Fictibacillus barbaricus]|uniref:DNA-binding transcriptional LysR family regulator n=1 Tax=Fictibacillus barbaricus TaxID=182136 RepID=A0ABU1TV77_9BACL|nr:LysR family transcriptional regulator [Fictibacillus barbaricus]MDR7071095.1 DNA-binding transcriptional LysR family regulator [Fictibacillus barbaricus]